MSTICTGVMGIVGLMMVHRTSKPYNKLRIAMMIVLTLSFLVAFFFLPEIFTLKVLDFSSTLILIVFGLLAWPVLNLFSRVNDKLREQLSGFCAEDDVIGRKTVLRAAALGNDAGIIGAALLGKEQP